MSSYRVPEGTRFIKNRSTSKMHYTRDGEGLACNRPLPQNADMSPSIYGLHDWCVGCHSYYVDDQRAERPIPKGNTK